VGDEHQLLTSMALFVVFSAMLGYWYARLAEGGYVRAVQTTFRSTRRSSAGLFVTVAIAAVLAIVVRGFWLGSYRVLSASMLPTLEPDDLVGGSKWAYGFAGIGELPPVRGDIVVFRKPSGIEGPDRLVKRVIGLPGDRIAMNGGHAVINGWQVPSCDAGTYLYPIPDGAVRGRLSVEFLDDHAYLTVFAPNPNPWAGTYDVKPGEAFVLGDNRNNSTDSRLWNRGQGGGLSFRAIEARAAWWLLGTHRDQRTDLDHVLRPLELRVRLEGMNVRSIEEGVERCLEGRPAATHPPESHGS
jgi:signal peptidase I